MIADGQKAVCFQRGDLPPLAEVGTQPGAHRVAAQQTAQEDVAAIYGGMVAAVEEGIDRPDQHPDPTHGLDDLGDQHKGSQGRHHDLIPQKQSLGGSLDRQGGKEKQQQEYNDTDPGDEHARSGPFLVFYYYIKGLGRFMPLERRKNS